MNLSVHNIAMDWGDATQIDRYRSVLEYDKNKDITSWYVRTRSTGDQLCAVSQKSTG